MSSTALEVSEKRDAGERGAKRELSWIVGFDANTSPFEPLPHVHCARCGARRPFSLENMLVVRDFIDDHRACVLNVMPENFWREVWHDGCVKRGPMKGHRAETLTLDDGAILTRFECLGCGVNCYAGLNKQRYVTTRPYPANATPAKAQLTQNDSATQVGSPMTGNG